MNTTRIIGIILIVIGVISLAYQGISVRTQERERVLELGPIKVDATVEKERRLPLPPILGVLALAGGVTLMVVAAKKGAA